jgi:uncharacterized protein
VIVWDERKRLINLRKHGLDFKDAHLVYNDPGKMTISTPRSGEDRRMDTALIEMLDSVLAFVYVERDGDIRAISFRRASRKERRLYAKFTQEKPD